MYCLERGIKMDDTTKQGNHQGGGSKRLISIILVIALVVAGGITAYAFLNKTPKTKYFLAEKKSSEFISDIIDQRFNNELEWRENVDENPSEITYDLSAQMNSGSGMSTGLFSPDQIVNSSNLTLTTAKDLEDKIMSTELSGSVAGVDIEGIKYFLTSEAVWVDLPFEDDTLKLKGDDVGQVLHALDPYSADEDLKIDFNLFFEWMEGILSEEDKDYFKEEYFEMIYEDLPDEAFQTDNDKITVDGESIKAEKITMHLTEEEVKDILSSIVNKMSNDDRVKEKLDDLYNLFDIGDSIDPTGDYDVEDFIGEFEDGLDEVIDEINELSIPDGLTSTIWTNKNLILQREFLLNIGPSDSELVKFDINGTQLLDDKKQLLDYEYSVDDGYSQETVFIVGESSIDKEDAEDSIELSFDDTSIRYEATETLDDTKKDFERTFIIDDVGLENKILWSGSANYDKEQMSSNHEFSIEDANIDSDMFSLHIEKEGKLIKEVEQPSEDSKDLGEMSDIELLEYLQYELPTKAEEWLFGSMDTMW